LPFWLDYNIIIIQATSIRKAVQQIIKQIHCFFTENHEKLIYSFWKGGGLMITEKSGIPTGIIAYILWGLLPIYSQHSEHIGADIVLAHRIIRSFVLSIVFVLITL